MILATNTLFFISLIAANLVPTLAAAPSDLADGIAPRASLAATAVAWSPDGARLLYAQLDGLWIAPASDLAAAKRIVRTPATAAEQVAWSADGNQIVFAAQRPGDDWDTIWLVDNDGAHVRDMLPIGSPVGSTGIRSIGLVGWNDRGELVFWVHCGTECSRFEALDVSTGRTTEYCIGSGFSAWADRAARGACSFQSGGVGIIERAAGDDDAGCREVLDPLEFGPHPITRTFDAWSPDARRLLYTAWATPGTPAGSPTLAVLDVDSSKRRMLLERAAWGAWSPDGARIAAIRITRATRDRNAVTLDLLLLHATSGRVIATLSLGRTSDATRVLDERIENKTTAPVWSPDGSRVTVVDAAGSVLLFDVTSRTARALTHNVPATTTWSPDGSRLALTIPNRTPWSHADGVDAWLPPSGSDEAAITAAQLIDRYYGDALATLRDGSPLDYWDGAYLQSYANALWALGRLHDAEARFREALDVSTNDFRDERSSELGRFLRCTGREDEAERVEPPPPPPPNRMSGGVIGGRLLTPEELAAQATVDPCRGIDPAKPSPREEREPRTSVYVIDVPPVAGAAARP